MENATLRVSLSTITTRVLSIVSGADAAALAGGGPAVAGSAWKSFFIAARNAGEYPPAMPIISCDWLYWLL
jgi:hypothetical protein